MKLKAWLLAAVLLAGAAAALTVAIGGDGWLSSPASARSVVLGVDGEIPYLGGATAWLNSEPLTVADLRGKVVLIDFWTYTCINWRRSLPYVRAWAAKYKDHGLVVIGVHSPEFEFEQDSSNVRRAVTEMRIDYPVAVDSDMAIWNAFRNDYWPALYFIDAQGHIRHHVFGEGQYAESETVIQRLLVEAGQRDVDPGLVSVHASGAEAAADWDSLKSRENYVGYERTENFVSRDGTIGDKNHRYAAPARLWLNHWALSGEWTVARQSIVLNHARGSILYRFHARDLHVVMGPGGRGTSVRFRVLIDGQPPGNGHGEDVDEQGYGTASEPRMYQLIRQLEPISDRQVQIEFLDPGVQVFSFTFG